MNNSIINIIDKDVLITIIVCTVLLLILVSVTLITGFSKPKKKRDRKLVRKYLSSIVPTYNIPTDWNILRVQLLLETKISSRAITAQIIQLAIWGYIKIIHDKEKILLQRNSKNIETLPLPLQYFLDGIFQGSTQKIVYKDKTKQSTDSDSTEYAFLLNLNSVNKGFENRLFNEGFIVDPHRNKELNINLLTVLITPILSVISISMVGKVYNSNQILGVILFFLPFFIFLILSILTLIQKRQSKRKLTEKGKKVLREIQGLHMYIKIAEEEKLKFHGNPNKQLPLLQDLLPYAILFGIEKEWNEIFKDEAQEWFDDLVNSNSDIYFLSTSIDNYASHWTSIRGGGYGGYDKGVNKE